MHSIDRSMGQVWGRVYIMQSPVYSSRQCAVPDNIILHPWKVFCFALPVPQGNSSLASYFASQILTKRVPLPQEFPMTFHGMGLDFFLVKLAAQWSNIVQMCASTEQDKFPEICNTIQVPHTICSCCETSETSC